MADLQNSENINQKFLEPVTPSSSDGEQSSSPPPYSGYHHQHGYDLSDSLFHQNNNYVPYEDPGQRVNPRIQHVSPYTPTILYQSQVLSKPQLPSYQENSPPRETQQQQLPYQPTPSPPAHESRGLSHAYHGNAASDGFGPYGSELYKPYEDAVSNGMNSLAERSVLQHPNSDYQPTTTTIDTNQPQRGTNVSQKRARTQFTSLQLVEMEREFTEGRYLSRAKRINLAQKLNLTEKQIKVWFQNRRMKFNRDNKVNKNIKHCKALSPESSHSSGVGSPGMDRSETGRLLRHSPLLKYDAPLNNAGIYQGFPSTQWHDSMYPTSTYSHQPAYGTSMPPTISADASNYPSYSSLYNNYSSSCYSNSVSPYASTSFSSSLTQQSTQQVASKLAFQIKVPQAVKKEEYSGQSCPEYTPNVTVSWGPSGMVELQELK